MKRLPGRGLICATIMIDFVPNGTPPCSLPHSGGEVCVFPTRTANFLYLKNTFIDRTVLNLVSSPVLSI